MVPIHAGDDFHYPLPQIARSDFDAAREDFGVMTRNLPQWGAGHLPEKSGADENLTVL